MSNPDRPLRAAPDQAKHQGKDTGRSGYGSNSPSAAVVEAQFAAHFELHAFIGVEELLA